MNATVLLIAAAISSFVAAALHIAIIFGGAQWYRFFGAGEEMAQLSEKGSVVPPLITVTIATALTICGMYALSAANLALSLPFTNHVLFAISAVFLLRGILGFTLPFLSTHPSIIAQSISFWLVSSSICLIIGILFLAGVLLRE